MTEILSLLSIPAHKTGIERAILSQHLLQRTLICTLYPHLSLAPSMASTVQVQLLVTPILCVSRRCLASSDTISASSAVSGGRTVVSRGGSFQLGFFRINASSSSSSSRNGSCYYVGIWYKKAVSPCTPVWIANRAAPVADRATSRLAIAADGNLVLINEADELVWSTNVSSAAAAAAGAGSNGTVAVILDTGNLVLRRKNDVDEVVLWQSMDHPTDTWLPGARLGLNKVTGEAQVLTTWKNSGDPAPGVFSLGIDPAGTSQYFIVWNRTVPYWASGEWNGDIFAGIPEMTSHYMYNFEFVSDANGSYFTYSLQDPAIISRLVVGVSGQVTQLTWAPSADEWILIWTEPHRLCDVHAVCGAFAVCDEKSEPLCSCLAGFRAASPGDWDLGDYTKGCRRNTPLQCASTSMVTGDKDEDDFLLIAAEESIVCTGIRRSRLQVGLLDGLQLQRLLLRRSLRPVARRSPQLATADRRGGRRGQPLPPVVRHGRAIEKQQEDDRSGLRRRRSCVDPSSLRRHGVRAGSDAQEEAEHEIRASIGTWQPGGVQVQRREEGDQELLGESRRRQLRVGVQGEAARRRRCRRRRHGEEARRAPQRHGPTGNYFNNSSGCPSVYCMSSK